MQLNEIGHAKEIQENIWLPQISYPKINEIKGWESEDA